jgi:hypothetical protein
VGTGMGAQIWGVRIRRMGMVKIRWRQYAEGSSISNSDLAG